jgi:hypothetical protein
VWALQLSQMRGMSMERARAVATQYPSPSALYRAFRAAPEPQRRHLVSALPIPRARNALGPVLSEKLYQLFFTRNPDTDLNGP